MLETHRAPGGFRREMGAGMARLEAVKCSPWVRPLVLLVTAAALFLIPLKVVSYGFMPIDDALRHVAKAVSGRSWPEILVMRDGMAMDSHPGWHAFLGWFHQLTGAGMDALVVFSVVSLVLAFLLAPLLVAVRPEAWAAAVGIMFVVMGGGWGRLFFGRPFVLTMTAVVIFCFLAKQLSAVRNHWGAMATMAVAVTLSVWLNCTWYLWGLPVAAMLLARQWRGGVRTAGVVTVGVLAGACLTGQPLVFLWLNVHHLLLTMGNSQVTRQLVGELQPITNMSALLLASGLFLLWRKARGRELRECGESPVFMMLVLCWFLGIFVGRFLMDWGMPAMTVWIALELQPVMVRYFPRMSLRRLTLAAALALTVFVLFTRDTDGRWTNSLRVERLSLTDPDAPAKPSEYAQWLPEPGGIFYSDSMGLFYSTFYANPDAKWRYILGFEPGWMPVEDLQVYRKIQWNAGAFKCYEPWVKKMRPKDRLVLECGMGQPPIPGLEWHYAVTNVWIGRLPRAKAAAPAVAGKAAAAAATAAAKPVAAP